MEPSTIIHPGAVSAPLFSFSVVYSYKIFGFGFWTICIKSTNASGGTSSSRLAFIVLPLYHESSCYNFHNDAIILDINVIDINLSGKDDVFTHLKYRILPNK